MDIRARLHSVVALILLPTVVAAPALGALAVVACAALGRPVRRAPSRDAAIVLGGVATVVGVVHADAWWQAAAAAGIAWATMWVIVRFDATTTRASGYALALGTVATSVVLTGLSIAQSFAMGFDQVAIATHHPNASATLGLVLAAGSALAWRLPLIARLASVVGVAGALVVVVLSGSRGGVVGIGGAVVMLLAIALVRKASRGWRPDVAPALMAAVAVAVVVAVQLVIVQPGVVPPWPGATPSTAAPVVAASEGDGRTTFVARLRSLAWPQGTTGGRLAAWKLAREMIAERPMLGYGFDSNVRIFAPGANRELSQPLSHPHSGFLFTLLQGGSLLLVAIFALVGGILLRLMLVRGSRLVPSDVVLAIAIGVFVTELLDAVLRFGNVGGPFLLTLLFAAGASSSLRRDRD